MVPPKPTRVKTLTDEQWKNASLPERALHVARSYDGERESAPNDSKIIRLWLKLSGVFTPAPWCAAFVTACLLEAGADRKKLPKFAASTYYWYVWAKAKGRLRTIPKRGTAFIYNKSSGGHTGWVLESLNEGKRIRTIEGNTNDEGSREGYEVCDRQRWVSELQRYPRWGFIDVSNLE